MIFFASVSKTNACIMYRGMKIWNELPSDITCFVISKMRFKNR